MEHCKKNDNNKGLSDSNNNVDGIVLGTSDNDRSVNNNNIDIVEGINKINITNMSKCAACGKGGDNLKVCTSCEQVSYCNAKCRKAHRSTHKKECKKLAAERKLKDDKLFAEPPTKEDCPICMQPIPYSVGLCGVYTVYEPCCGKTLCEGCLMEAQEEIDNGNLKPWCAFCRVPNAESNEERLERVHKRMELKDSAAFDWLARVYYNGDLGFSPDVNKALGLWKTAADIGSIQAHHQIAIMYQQSDGVEQNEDKAIHHYELQP